MVERECDYVSVIKHGARVTFVYICLLANLLLLFYICLNHLIFVAEFIMRDLKTVIPNLSFKVSHFVLN